MKIIKQTQSQLICRSHSLFVAWMGWIFGFSATSIGLTLLIIGLPSVGMPPTLDCQRTPEQSVNCQLKKYQFPLSWKITNIPAGDLQQARLDRDSGKEGTYGHRVVLVTRSSEIPMKESYSSGEDYQQKEYQQKIVDRINNFLANPNQKSVSVKYIEDESGLQLFLSFCCYLAILTAGIGCMLNRWNLATFDRDLNGFTLKQTNAFGTKFFDRSLAEITDIVLEKGRPSHEDGTPYNIFIVMASGDRLLLSCGWNISKKQQEILNNLREYLNLH